MLLLSFYAIFVIPWFFSYSDTYPVMSGPLLVAKSAPTLSAERASGAQCHSSPTYRRTACRGASPRRAQLTASFGSARRFFPSLPRRHLAASSAPRAIGCSGSHPPAPSPGDLDLGRLRCYLTVPAGFPRSPRGYLTQLAPSPPQDPHAWTCAAPMIGSTRGTTTGTTGALSVVSSDSKRACGRMASEKFWISRRLPVRGHSARIATTWALPMGWGVRCWS